MRITLQVQARGAGREARVQAGCCARRSARLRLTAFRSHIPPRTTAAAGFMREQHKSNLRI